MAAAALVITVAVVASGSAAPQLAVAEFAPAARSEPPAPPTTAGESPATSGSGARGGWTTTTATPTTRPTGSDDASAAATAPTTRVGRGRPCYGNPPRQAEDPQSPPCVPVMFEGDNGGATSKGVTATEVLIAVPSIGTTYEPHYKLLFEYFNQHYEFYGRRLRPLILPIGNADPTGLRSLGAEIAATGAFGSLDYIAARGSSLHQELARQGVVTVTTGLENLLTDRTLYDPLHPFIWSVYPSTEQVWRNLAELACTALVGRPPRHADPTLQQVPQRKFGVISQGNYAVPLTSELEAALSSCDAAPVVVQTDQARDGATGQRTALQKLKDAGVTTMICACMSRAFGTVVATAYRDVQFRPEWLLPSFTYGAASEESTVQGLMPEERRHIFGLMPFPKLLPLQSQPWFHFQEGVGTNDPGAMEAAYRMMLMMASGIQAAGPNLTPETFAAGLMSARFPNPGAGAAPFWQPSVGFGPGDHAFFDDYALAWWDNSAPPRGYRGVQGRGSWCYLDDGARYRVGEYPRDADSRFFDPSASCR